MRTLWACDAGGVGRVGGVDIVGVRQTRVTEGIGVGRRGAVRVEGDGVGGRRQGGGACGGGERGGSAGKRQQREDWRLPRKISQGDPTRVHTVPAKLHGPEWM